MSTRKAAGDPKHGKAPDDAIAQGPASALSIELRPKPERIFVALLLCVCFLVIAGTASNLLKFNLGIRYAWGFVDLFDLNRENNIPTWFSTLILFSSAILLGLIAKGKFASHDRWRRHWGILGFAFLMLSLDEAASIHEATTAPMRRLFDLDGIFYYAWIVPAMVALLGFAALYLRFLLALPRKTGWLFVIAGSLYVLGAVGIEMIGGAHASAHGSQDMVYGLITTCEETLEMLGITTFIYGLTDYIRSQFDNVALRIPPRSA